MQSPPPHLLCKQVAAALPAVLLGLIFNILDAISSGLVLFPTGVSQFAEMNANAPTMYLLSTCLCQIVYVFGGSGFPGAAGSMLIEIIPLMHMMSNSILQQLGPESPQLIPTVLVTYAMTSLLLGISFVALGLLKTGRFVGFFPKLVLSGAIGAIGFELFALGIEVTADLHWEYTLEFFKQLFQPAHLLLVGIAIGIAILLSILVRKIDHKMLVPAYFITVTIVFYLATIGTSWESLQTHHWLFIVPESVRSKPFYAFYEEFKFGNVAWSAIPSAIPAMILLVIIGLIHPPMYVPALATAIKKPKYDLDVENIGHGLGNILAGVFGTVPNYLVYSNSLLFTRSGGNRIAGGILALLTGLVMIVGKDLMGLVPTVLAGAMVIFLGIELMFEALVDGWRVLRLSEYLTVVGTMVASIALGFGPGLMFGLGVACFIFTIRAARLPLFRDECQVGLIADSIDDDRTSRYIQIVGLQGFLFFGLAPSLEKRLRAAADKLSVRRDGITRFIVLDMERVTDLETSVAQQLLQIMKEFDEGKVLFAFAGFASGDPVGVILEKVGITLKEEPDIRDGDGDGDERTACFSSSRDAIAYCREKIEEEQRITRVSTVTIQNEKE